MSIIDKPIVKTLMLKGEKGDPGDLDSTAIVDNLTTNRADKVLSAKQGKVLKDLVDANKIVSDHGIINLNSALDLKANTADVASEYATKESVNDNISSLDAKVNSLASGSPLVASSVSGMTQTDKVYVNTSDGKWYYYDGDSWEIGGVYQATVQDYDTTLTVDNAVANSKSIGDKLNKLVHTENLFKWENCIDGKSYLSDGSLQDANAFITQVIKVKENDTILSQYLKDNEIFTYFNMQQIAKVDGLGNFISLIANYNLPYWKADEECFVRLVINKKTATPLYQTNTSITINTPNNLYKEYNYSLKENNDEINQISYYKNLFDINECANNTSIDLHGNFVEATNYFTTNLMECKIGDVFYLKYHNDNVTNIHITNVFRYDENGQIIGRISNNNGNNYTADFNGFVKFTCQNPSNSILDNYLTISKNEQLSEYIPHIRVLKLEQEEHKNVVIKKIDTNNYSIIFGRFKCLLFYTDNEYTNSHNWNIKRITDINGNIIVPDGTDIIGPIKINDNDDYIGGVHGDETTDDIKISINGATYNITDINDIGGNNMTITMKSTCYDQITKVASYERYITIIFENNKIKISNTFKALVNNTLKRATNGGLIACRNNIINSIKFNNSYFETPPEQTVNNSSKYNTTATINTIYGSVTVNNIKGYTNEQYDGKLQVFTNENPMRCKIYFDTYKPDNYSMNIGDIIPGEFEYLFS